MSNTKLFTAKHGISMNIKKNVQIFISNFYNPLPDGAFFVTLDGFLVISTPMKKNSDQIKIMKEFLSTDSKLLLLLHSYFTCTLNYML